MIAITYPDPQTAAKAMAKVDWAQFDNLVNVIDACWMSNEDGNVSIHPSGHPVALMATIGGALGLVIGACFGLPVAGLAVGAAIASHEEKLGKGRVDPFVESIKDQVAAGGSALVVLYEDGADNERAGADLLEFGGTVQSTTIPADRLAEIQARLDLATNDSSPLD
jgi:uncharacterized membrane protein